MPLRHVRTALDGRVDEALKLIDAGHRWVIRGLLIFGVFTATALISAIRSAPFEIAVSPFVLRITDWWVSTIMSIILGLPFILVGLGRVRRAGRMLSEETAQKTAEVGASTESDRYLTAAPLSVTESTTRELAKPSAQDAKPSSE
jgi:hypothetical protein